jgi:hypothetical protein
MNMDVAPKRVFTFGTYGKLQSTKDRTFFSGGFLNFSFKFFT